MAPVVSADAGGTPSDVLATADAKEAACPPDLPGPELVALPALDGSWYCMDATEVTQAHYWKFLSAKGAIPEQDVAGDTSEQRKECDKNTFFYVPSWAQQPCGEVPQAFDRYGRYPDNPVACVDWCDASAYCAWAGKRLCGKIGGGTLSQDELAAAGSSEWYNACSQGGKTTYPYGDTYEPGVCADKASRDASLAAGIPDDQIPAHPPPTCHGQSAPFDGLHQLCGNVGEWEDACDFPYAYPQCRVRGGIWGRELPDDLNYRCDGSASLSQYAIGPTVGFRCCSDTSP